MVAQERAAYRTSLCKENFGAQCNERRGGHGFMGCAVVMNSARAGGARTSRGRPFSTRDFNETTIGILTEDQPAGWTIFHRVRWMGHFGDAGARRYVSHRSIKQLSLR